MTPKERRGKRSFLLIASLIAFDKVAGVVVALLRDWDEINWLRTVVMPICFLCAVAVLWQGDKVFRWLVGAACLVTGAALLQVSVHVGLTFAEITPPEATNFFLRTIGLPMGMVGVWGLAWVIAGLLILLSPSMKAFFAYQRERAKLASL